MIGLLTGIVFDNQTNPIVVDVHGVGYRVFIPEHLLGEHSGNSQATYYIHTHVTDDAITLFGFGTKEELRIFTMLLSVSGIGPRTALAIINRGPTQVQKAIESSDVDFFTTIPRLGKKNAQKIIIELKSKLGSVKDLDLGQDTPSETKDIVDALTHMGFAKQEVMEAIKHLDEKDATLEQKIRQTLKLLGKGVAI